MSKIIIEIKNIIMIKWLIHLIINNTSLINTTIHKINKINNFIINNNINTTITQLIQIFINKIMKWSLRIIKKNLITQINNIKFTNKIKNKNKLIIIKNNSHLKIKTKINMKFINKIVHYKINICLKNSLKTLGLNWGPKKIIKINDHHTFEFYIFLWKLIII